MASLLKSFWHLLRPGLGALVGEQRLTRFLFRLGFYRWKSRLLLKLGHYPDGIQLWHRESDDIAIEEVCARNIYGCVGMRAGDIVLDIGANIGAFSVKASKQAGMNGKVLCFEPEPENLHILKKNISLNGCSNAHIYPIALAERDGTTQLFVREAAGSHSIMGGPGVGILVTTRRLDGIIAELGLHGIAAMKIDTEGAELKILSGAPQTLLMTRQVVMEVHKQWASISAITDRLSQSGFTCRILQEDTVAALVYGHRAEQG